MPFCVHCPARADHAYTHGHPAFPGAGSCLERDMGSITQRRRRPAGRCLSSTPSAPHCQPPLTRSTMHMHLTCICTCTGAARLQVGSRPTHAASQPSSLARHIPNHARHLGARGLPSRRAFEGVCRISLPCRPGGQVATHVSESPAWGHSIRAHLPTRTPHRLCTSAGGTQTDGYVRDTSPWQWEGRRARCGAHLGWRRRPTHVASRHTGIEMDGALCHLCPCHLLHVLHLADEETGSSPSSRRSAPGVIPQHVLPVGSFVLPSWRSTVAIRRRRAATVLRRGRRGALWRRPPLAAVVLRRWRLAGALLRRR